MESCTILGTVLTSRRSYPRLVSQDRSRYGFPNQPMVERSTSPQDEGRYRLVRTGDNIVLVWRARDVTNGGVKAKRHG